MVASIRYLRTKARSVARLATYVSALEPEKQLSLDGKGAFGKGAFGKGAYGLLAIDLDGTLLADDHEIPAETASYFRSLNDDRGVHVVIATGRGVGSVIPHCETLGLGNVGGPDGASSPCFVCFNGSCAMKLKREPDFAEYRRSKDLGAVVELPPLFSRPMAPALARDTLALAKVLNLGVQYYLENGDVIAEVDRSDKDREAEQRDLLRRYRELTGKPQIICGDPSRSGGDHPASLAGAVEAGEIGPPYKMLLMTEAPADTFGTVTLALKPGPQTCHVISADFFVEILPPGTNKAVALEAVCREFGLALESDAVFFGDGNNDVEAIGRAALGVAMANAEPDPIKAAKGRQTRYSNDEQGVMRFVRGLELQGALR